MIIDADYFIFDMDGLMIDSERLVYYILKEELEKDGYFLDIEFYKNMIGIPDEDMKYKFYDRYGKDFDFQKYLENYKIKLNEIYNTKGVELKKGLIELLDFLKSKDKKLAVATSSTREIVELILKKSNVYNYFDYFVTYEDVKRHKPKPDVFLKALNIANMEAKNSIVLEDSQNGLIASYNANIRSIFVKDMVQPDKSVLDNVYYICETLSDIIKFIK